LQGRDCGCGHRSKIGGVKDHVHILRGLSRKISLAELVKNLKTSSTKILKAKGHDGFSWQSGYGAFSVSQSAKVSVFSYIAEQEIHHRRMNFQNEFRALLNKHGIHFDERYVCMGLIEAIHAPKGLKVSAQGSAWFQPWAHRSTCEQNTGWKPMLH
jgi:Transposase IS200 like